MLWPAQQPLSSDQRQRFLIVVVDQHAIGRKAKRFDERERANRAAFLVPVRCMDQHRQVELPRQLDLPAKDPLFGVGLIVEADLADSHDTVLHEKARKHVEHVTGQAGIIGLLGIETHGAEVLDAELAGSKSLPSEQTVEVVDERSDAGSRLTQPEGGLDDRDDPRGRHGLVVVGRARRHVHVRIDDVHLVVPRVVISAVTSTISAGTVRPAARRSAA